MFSIASYEHVGIRVSDRDASLRFYQGLGFHLTLDLPEYAAAELQTASGVMLNLIFNALPDAQRHNVLLDAPHKWPGVTHPAFVVDDLDAVQAHCLRHGIAITQGPQWIGERRRALFIRDPDGTVLEFDQIYPQGEK